MILKKEEEEGGERRRHQFVMITAPDFPVTIHVSTIM
jgi:hypothetical protein